VKTDVVQCAECRIIYTSPTLIPQTNPYQQETTEEYFRLHDFRRKIGAGEALAAFAEGVLGKPGRMLEIGCGRGELLIGAAHRGWKVSGIEMTEEFAQAARDEGVEIECSPVEVSKSLNREYDVVLLAAVLEHLYKPVDVLFRVHDALRSGGLIFIDVPNERSLGMRIGNRYMRARGRDWAVNLSPTFSPFHVVGFSPDSLRRVLESTGFRVHSLEVPKWSNNLPEGRSLMERIEKTAMGLVQSLGARVGMGDGINCWAVRQ
jgi:2-polyprenyl-3-methyl-5-hydroxy-6-metoxy-1,4-benzoquinol methylase